MVGHLGWELFAARRCNMRLGLMYKISHTGNPWAKWLNTAKRVPLVSCLFQYLAPTKSISFNSTAHHNMGWKTSPRCGDKQQNFQAAEPRKLDSVAVTRSANYNVTRCECRDPGSKPMREQFYFHFYCLRLTRLTLNKS